MADDDPGTLLRGRPSLVVYCNPDSDYDDDNNQQDGLQAPEDWHQYCDDIINHSQTRLDETVQAMAHTYMRTCSTGQLLQEQQRQRHHQHRQESNESDCSLEMLRDRSKHDDDDELTLDSSKSMTSFSMDVSSSDVSCYGRHPHCELDSIDSGISSTNNIHAVSGKNRLSSCDHDEDDDASVSSNITKTGGDPSDTTREADTNSYSDGDDYDDGDVFLKVPDTKNNAFRVSCNGLNKQSSVSTSEVRTCYNQSTSSLKMDHSPSSKSVKSMSAISSTNTSSKSLSWMPSFSKSSKGGRKKSLTSLFDAVTSNRSARDKDSKEAMIAKSDQNLSQLVHPPKEHRAKLPATDGHFRNKFSRKHSHDMARLATSNLRNPQLAQRKCHSTEDLDDEDDVTYAEDKAVQPMGYYTVDSGRKKLSAKDKKLLHCIKQFNLDAYRGIRILMEEECLETRSAKSVARFMLTEGRLSKKQIGKFLGGHEEFNRGVLKEFVRLHQFTHLILVQAMRQFFMTFRLPGEAMQIDRIMEAFAEHYCAENPNLFEETDTCFILSFSIIMLNTALHNPNVPQKITLEQFVKQNRGINSGKDLPRDILELIYKSIKDEPFKIPDETYDDLNYTFFSPEKEGWLHKQGGSWKSWQRRWFVLNDRCLYYFQFTAESVPKGIIPLENVKVRRLDDVGGWSYCFEVYSATDSIVKGCKTDSKGAVVQGNHKSYIMSATSEEERSEWVRNIEESIMLNPHQANIDRKKAALRRRQLSGGGVWGTPGRSTLTPGSRQNREPRSSSKGSSRPGSPSAKHRSPSAQRRGTPISHRRSPSATRRSPMVPRHSPHVNARRQLHLPPPQGSPATSTPTGKRARGKPPMSPRKSPHTALPASTTV